MKNRTIFSSVVLAFLVSAFFMSVSTVFGANPTGQPPAGVVGPTFSGVYITDPGYLRTGGVLSNTGSVTIGSNSAPDEIGDVSFIYIGETFVPGDPGESVIKIASEVPNKNITIDTGGGGTIFLNDPVEAYQLSVTDGTITTNGLKAELGDSLGISTSNPTGASTTYINLIPTGSGVPESKGIILNSDWGVHVKSSLGLSNNIVSDTDSDVNIGEGLTVSGHLKAASVGTFTRRTGSASAVANDSATVTSSCLAGETLLSCSFYAAQFFYPYKIIPSPSLTAGTCTVTGKDSSGIPGYTLYAYAICLDPAK